MGTPIFPQWFSVRYSPGSLRQFLLVLLCYSFGAKIIIAEQFVEAVAEMNLSERMWTTDALQPNKPSASVRTQHWTSTFKAILSETQWHLEGRFSVNGLDKWHYDGTNVTRSSQILSALPPEMDPDNSVFEGVSMDELRSNVTINIYRTPGGYLPGTLSDNIAWLAFCSANFLKQPGRVIPLPVEVKGHAPDVFGYSDRTETFDDSLGLPRQVELLTSKAHYEASAVEFAKSKKWKAARQKLDRPDGLLKFVYSVTQHTNFMGWSFPLAFEFKEEIPREFAGTFRATWGSGKLKSLSPTGPPAGVFNTALKQTVQDWRLTQPEQGVRGIMYGWTNDYVPPTDDPRLQDELKRSVDRVSDATRARRK